LDAGCAYAIEPIESGEDARARDFLLALPYVEEFMALPVMMDGIGIQILGAL
jgi:hypothetical protein